MMGNNSNFDTTDENFFDRNKIRRPRVKNGEDKRKITGARRMLNRRDGNHESKVSKAQVKNKSNFGNNRREKRLKKDEITGLMESSSSGNNSIFHKFSKKLKKEPNYAKKKEDTFEEKSYISNFKLKLKNFEKKKPLRSRKQICPMMEDVERYLLDSHKKWTLPKIDNPKLYQATKIALRKFEFMEKVSELKPITVILAHHLISRVATKVATEKELEKYTIPSLFVAMKFEEYWPENIKRLKKYMYVKFGQVPPTKQQILQYERLLMEKVEFDVFKPPILDFINLFGTRFWTQKSILNSARKFVPILMKIPDIYSFKPQSIALTALELAYKRSGLKKELDKKKPDSGLDPQEFEDADKLIQIVYQLSSNSRMRRNLSSR